MPMRVSFLVPALLLGLAAMAVPLRVFDNDESIMVPLPYVCEWLDAKLQESDGGARVTATKGERSLAVRAAADR